MVPGLASPISIAGGMEWRDENYQQLLGDAASYAAGPYASQPLYNCVAGVCTRALDAKGAPITATQSTASNGYGGISAPVDPSQFPYPASLAVEAHVFPPL